MAGGNAVDTQVLRKRRLDFISKLMFETPGGARFTQDSPVLTNVWLKYAMEPRAPQKLILTVDRERGAGAAAATLRAMLQRFRSRLGSDTDGYHLKTPIGTLPGEAERGRAKISYISGQISAELYFDEMMRVVLPLTPWWRDTYNKLQKIDGNSGAAHWLRFPMPHDKPGRDSSSAHRERYHVLRCGLLNMRTNIDTEMGIEVAELRRVLQLPDMNDKESIEVTQLKALPTSLLWLIRIGGIIGRAFNEGFELLDKADDSGRQLEREFLRRMHSKRSYAGEDEQTQAQLNKRAKRITQTRDKILDGFLGIYENWSNDDQPQHPEPCIWRVTRNRPITLAVNKSSLTVKADAARRLFDISCDRITWAVIDSGIDSEHPAFIDHAGGGTTSRVTRTYDFTKIREMLDYDLISTNGGADDAAKELYKGLVETVAKKFRAAGLKPTMKEARREAKLRLSRLSSRMENGQDIDWEDLEQLILDESPDAPVSDHGTHVAGILGADWLDDDEDPDSGVPIKDRPRKMQGMCPDIKLYDVRVFRSDGATDEFELLAAVQFLRWLNSRAGYMVVQGANLSLSLIHEVRRFACGKTPICDECDESVALGMVMVAAAGNYGFEATDIDELTFGDGFSDSSITDPGNAEGVITVGATHRKRPYDYGVSYFSSRGPTGDGRVKPDIIAPGEKIKAPTPNEGFEFKDGTSMAAPHVSGAAAMLMARNRELIGKPQRIKQVLCESASDMGRERYFQGHGLLDVLRALQSV